MKTILVTGGLGYIGSHICIDLLENNYNIIIMDNMSNSSIEKLEIIKKYNKFNKQIHFYDINLVVYDALYKIIYSLMKELKISNSKAAEHAMNAAKNPNNRLANGGLGYLIWLTKKSRT